MGIEEACFVGEVKDQYFCIICFLVLEDPIKSLFCEHMYCRVCINGWLAVEKSCPADKIPLTVDHLIPAKSVRISLSKLNMKCIYYPKGCEASIPMEHLQSHAASCKYSPKAETICDKGCNIKMLRRDYEESDCRDHVQAEIDKLREELAHLHGQLNPIKPTVHSDQNLDYNMNTFEFMEEIIFDDYGPSVFESVKNAQQEDMLNSRNSSITPPKWQVFSNFRTSFGQSEQTNILEIDDKSPYAFAQTFTGLSVIKPNFSIQIVNIEYYKYVAIGLTCRGHPVDVLPGLHNLSVGFDSEGDFIVDKKSKRVGLQWKSGDIIECYIKFPNGLTGEISEGVKVYFSRNQRLISETLITMPSDGLFPSVYMFEGATGSRFSCSKVKFLNL